MICAWYDAMQYWLTLSCEFCLLLMCAREPRISTKEPCTAAKESCISAKKTWNSVICAWYDAMQCWLTLSSDYCLFVCAKEPRISTKEPCAAANELCISAFPHKKSPGIMQFEQMRCNPELALAPSCNDVYVYFAKSLNLRQTALYFRQKIFEILLFEHLRCNPDLVGATGMM